MNMTSAHISPDQLTAWFGKDGRMQAHSVAPFNLESSLDLLADAITPIEHFFLRNNHAIPTLVPAEWTLTVDGHVERPFTLSYAELRQLPAASMVAFLECYGNGRLRFAEQGQPAEGVPWRNGAIGNAEWIGVPVAQLLERATDLAGDIQPMDVPFNQKGYLMNAIEILPVLVE